MPVIETLLATVTVGELVKSVAGARTDRAICAALGVAWGGFRRYKKVDSDRLQTALRWAYVESCAELAASLLFPEVAKEIRGSDWVPGRLLGEMSQLYAEPDPDNPIDDKLREAVLKDLELDLRVWAPQGEQREQILIGARQGWDGARSLREAISTKFRAEVDRDDSTVGTLWLRDTLAGAMKALYELKDDHVAILKALESLSAQIVALVTKLERLRERAGEAERPFVRIHEAPPPGFVERRELSGWLDERWSNGVGPSLLAGDPGAGKSTLALAMAWRIAVTDRTVVQQFCGKGQELETVGAELARRLPGCDPNADPKVQIEWARDLLREREALLILDDVWDEKLRGLAPGPPARVIYTSRRRDLLELPQDQVGEVGGFKSVEVDIMLDKRLPEWVDTHGEELRELAKRVEELPYALDVAAGLLRRSRRPKGKAIEHVRGALGGKFELYRDAARAHTPEAQRLLRAVALCAQEGVWLPFAAELAGLEGEAVWDAVEALADAALLRTVDREERVFGMHAVMRTALAEESKGLEEARVLALERMFGEWDEDRSKWKDCARVLAEGENAVEWLARGGDEARFTRLSHLAFEFGYLTGRLPIAKRFLERQERLYEASGDRAGLLRSYGNQALILQDWGRLDQAMELHKRVESIAKDIGDRMQEQRSYGNQALILKAWGRLDEAMELHKRVQAICDELGDRAGLARCYGNQGNLLLEIGQVEEARVAMGKSLEIFTSLGMPRERDQAQRLLDEMGLGSGAAGS